VAERVHHVLGAVPEWRPVSALALPAGGLDGFRCAEEESIHRAGLEARAAAAGLQPVRWPETYPADTAWALLAATYAASIGRVVAFSLAAFRQAFAAGRDLGDRDSVLIAAAACELHPAAVVKGAELASTRRRLEEATAAAIAAGVREVPAIGVAGEVFHGEAELGAAAAALAAAGVPAR
jgi:2-hydroxychromene-2-carboxylate isomerase